MFEISFKITKYSSIKYPTNYDNNFSTMPIEQINYKHSYNTNRAITTSLFTLSAINSLTPRPNPTTENSLSKRSSLPSIHDNIALPPLSKKSKLSLSPRYRRRRASAAWRLSARPADPRRTSAFRRASRDCPRARPRDRPPCPSA